MQRIVRILAGALVVGAVAGSDIGFADDPPPLYYISMRDLHVQEAPSFILVVTPATQERSVAISVCHNKTLYATSADAAAIASARSAGQVVQLHRGETGQSPETMPIACVIDAAN